MSVAKKCIPDYYFESIYAIDYQMLKEQGINTLFFDLDNTLIPYDEAELSSRTIDFINALLEDFKIVIISNSGYQRVSKAVKKYAFVWHAIKPFRHGLKKALQKADAAIGNVVLIGDQLMTDMLGGHRFGCQTILVNPVKRTSDRWITKINRTMEKRVLKKIKRKFPELFKERLEAYVSDTL